ncbi:MAG: hypothetical protein WC604_00835 [Candidatus Gracilibacteria bacterium]
MGIYDAAKDAAKILKEAGKIEEYQKILDLIDDLFEKRNEIEKLKEENAKLKDQVKVKDEYIYKNNCYWHKETKDGPFCSRCFDKHKELIRIHPTFIESNLAVCPECKNSANFTGRANSYGAKKYL